MARPVGAGRRLVAFHTRRDGRTRPACTAGRDRTGPRPTRILGAALQTTCAPTSTVRDMNRVRGLGAVVVVCWSACAGPAHARVDMDGRAIVDSAGAVAGANPVATGTLRQTGGGTIHLDDVPDINGPGHVS